MGQRVVAFTGFSGAGKTTLIVSLIEALTASGKRVAAIKHTHHPLNEENRGDTARFRGAGAEPVILAGDGGGVVFAHDGITRVMYAAPTDLLQHLDADVVLVEGFKSFQGWTNVHVDPSHRPTLAEAMAILDRISPS